MAYPNYSVIKNVDVYVKEDEFAPKDGEPITYYRAIIYVYGNRCQLELKPKDSTTANLLAGVAEPITIDKLPTVLKK